MDHTLWSKVINQVDEIHSSTNAYLRTSNIPIFHAFWSKLPHGVLKMNVDGSHIHSSGSSECGGTLQVHHCNLLKGLYCKVSSSTSICWCLGPSKRSLSCSWFGCYRGRLWNRFSCSFSYGQERSYHLYSFDPSSPRNLHITSLSKANRCAQMLAQCGHSAPFSITVLDHVLDYLQPIVLCDAIVVFLHNIWVNKLASFINKKKLWKT